MTPTFRVLANDKDITEFVNTNTSRIEFIDEEGEQSDEITFEFVGEYRRPKHGDELKLWLGTKEDGDFFCGLFVVQNPKTKSAEKKSVEVSAVAANFTKGLKVKRSKTYENVSIKKVASIVAARNDLELKSDFDDIYIEHLEQTGESDISFLKRIANEYNAIFAIKNNKLLCLKKIKDNQKSKDLPRYTLEVDNQSYVEIEATDKTLYNSCKAIWRDTKDNEQKSVTVGDGEPVKIIKDSFESMADAKVKAQATLEKANSKTKIGTISCAGFVLYAGGILDLVGTIEDDGEYHIKKATHSLDENGWNVRIEIEN